LIYPIKKKIFHSYVNWLVVSTPLKNMKVSWDYEFPTEWKNIMSQTTNQQTFTRRYPDNLIEISDHNYENHKFVGGKSTISMGIFW